MVPTRCAGLDHDVQCAHRCSAERPTSHILRCSHEGRTDNPTHCSARCLRPQGPEDGEIAYCEMCGSGGSLYSVPLQLLDFLSFGAKAIEKASTINEDTLAQTKRAMYSHLRKLFAGESHLLSEELQGIVRNELHHGYPFLNNHIRYTLKGAAYQFDNDAARYVADEMVRVADEEDDIDEQARFDNSRLFPDETAMDLRPDGQVRPVQAPWSAPEADVVAARQLAAAYAVTEAVNFLLTHGGFIGKTEEACEEFIKAVLEMEGCPDQYRRAVTDNEDICTHIKASKIAHITFECIQEQYESNMRNRNADDLIADPTLGDRIIKTSTIAGCFAACYAFEEELHSLEQAREQARAEKRNRLFYQGRLRSLVQNSGGYFTAAHVHDAVDSATLELALPAMQWQSECLPIRVSKLALYRLIGDGSGVQRAKPIFDFLRGFAARGDRYRFLVPRVGLEPGTPWEIKQDRTTTALQIIRYYEVAVGYLSIMDMNPDTTIKALGQMTRLLYRAVNSTSERIQEEKFAQELGNMEKILFAFARKDLIPLHRRYLPTANYDPRRPQDITEFRTMNPGLGVPIEDRDPRTINQAHRGSLVGEVEDLERIYQETLEQAGDFLDEDNARELRGYIEERRQLIRTHDEGSEQHVLAVQIALRRLAAERPQLFEPESSPEPDSGLFAGPQLLFVDAGRRPPPTPTPPQAQAENEVSMVSLADRPAQANPLRRPEGSDEMEDDSESDSDFPQDSEEQLELLADSDEVETDSDLNADSDEGSDGSHSGIMREADYERWFGGW